MSKRSKNITLAFVNSWLRSTVGFVKIIKYGIVAIIAVLVAALPIGKPELRQCMLESAGAYHNYAGGGVVANCTIDEKTIAIKLPSGVPYLKDNEVKIYIQKRLLTGYTYIFQSYVNR